MPQAPPKTCKELRWGAAPLFKKQLFSDRGPRTSGISITRKLVKDANSQPPQTYWFKDSGHQLAEGVLLGILVTLRFENRGPNPGCISESPRECQHKPKLRIHARDLGLINAVHPFFLQYF